MTQRINYMQQSPELLSKTFVIAVVLCSWRVDGFACHGRAALSDGNGVRELMVKELADLPGKEGLMLTVTYPPGGGDEVHRHDAHGFIYVLEGSVVMQVKGGPPVMLKLGPKFL